MKKIHVIGKDTVKVDAMKKDLGSLGFIHVEENPDLVITCGGDGMFLIAERLFPGVPKIPLRDSDVGNMTHDLDIHEVLDLYSNDDFEIEEINKLKAVRYGKFEMRELTGINDIVIRNSLPTEAIRFRLRVGDGDWTEIMIGDGLVVSTSYGSNVGAYFNSITRKKFDSGIGIAFNNVTNFRDAMILSGEEKIEIEISRGIGIMVADNNRDYINLENGDKIVIEQTDDVARRIVLNDK